MNIPDDLKARYRWLTDRPIWTETHTPAPYSEEQLIERIASLEQQLAALKASHAELITQLESVGGYLLTAKLKNQPEWMEYIPTIIAGADAALARAREVQK